MDDYRITRFGNPLSKDKYCIDFNSRIFGTRENSLVLDFLGFNYWTFKTGVGCTFTVGDNCVFNTEDHCTFKTSWNCTFNTAWNCTFDTGDHCTFRTEDHCTFNINENNTTTTNVFSLYNIKTCIYVQ